MVDRYRALKELGTISDEMFGKNRVRKNKGNPNNLTGFENENLENSADEISSNEVDKS